MALDKCKECGNQISDKATSCPSCGAPIKRTSMGTKIVAGFIILAVFAGIQSSCSANKAKEEAAQAEAARMAAMSPEQRAAAEKAKAEAAAKKAERDLAINAASACRSFIKKNLKDPDSAQFEYADYEAPAHKNKKGIFEVQHKVRAKNSFGVLNLSYFNCNLMESGDKWILVDLKEVH